jgi:hypothetical protein
MQESFDRIVRDEAEFVEKWRYRLEVAWKSLNQDGSGFVCSSSPNATAELTLGYAP